MRRQSGFTLVELIIVVVLTGIVGAIVVMQVRPALQTYLSVSRRANLVNQADAALRRIVTDVRVAVPNSLRQEATAAGQCMEMVPTKDGGRYRMAPDLDHPADSSVFDPASTPIAFDVLSTLSDAAAKDLIVIGNENSGDLYLGKNVAQIASLDGALAGIRKHKITLATGASLPGSYDGGRFVVIPKENQIVGYVCVNPTPGVGNGTIKRTLRTIGDGQLACPAGGTAPVLVSKVSQCSFVFRENEGATQQSGYLQLRLGLSDGDETVTLTMGAHVENVP